jgi:outer membrane protein assembly factor BamB
MLSLIALLSGCIVSKTPNTNDITMTVGEQLTFSVVVFPPTATYAWTLDETPLSNTGSSYTYTAQGGGHFLIVRAKHIFGTDTQAWYIYGNYPPVADAGADQSVYVDATVTLNGSRSTDPDNDIASYNWRQIDGPTVTLTNPDKAITQFTAAVPVGSTMNFELTVTDAGGLKSTATCIINVTGVMKGPWSMFKHDPQHTGRSSYIGSMVANKKWEYNTGSHTMHCSPVVDWDNTVYIGSREPDSKIYAFDGATGAIKWAVIMGDVVSTPAIGDNDTLYWAIGSSLYALDKKTGVIKWQFDMGMVNGSPAIGPDGTVYIGSFDHKLYAINGITGQKIWGFAMGAPVEWSSPAVGPDGTIYIGNDDHNLYAIDSSTGTMKWSYDAGNMIWSSPSISDDGMIYFGTFDYNIGFEKILALDCSSGEKIWEFIVPDNIFASPSIGANGMVYVGCYSGTFYALDGEDGSLKWTAGGGEGSSPAIGADGTVYVGTYSYSVVAYDGETGALKWGCPLHSSVYASSPAIGSDGTIYIADSYGYVYAIGQ